MNYVKYNPNELLISIASRLMEDNVTCFIGTGIPMLAASLAQKRPANRQSLAPHQPWISKNIARVSHEAIALDVNPHAQMIDRNRNRKTELITRPANVTGVTHNKMTNVPRP
jgi:hypothetical protein